VANCERKIKMKKQNTLVVSVQTALLVALEIVLDRFCSFKTFDLKIGFAFVPVMLCAILFGPVWAAICWGLSDFVGALLFPSGPYFPGFTLSCVLMGLVYGLFLYRKDGREISFVRNIIPAVIIVQFVISLFLNSLWINILYGTPYTTLLAVRSVQCAVLTAVQLVIAPMLYKLSIKIRKAQKAYT
jgi:ECF transporter S component (folate family)